MDYLKTAEFAKRIGMSPVTVRSWVKKGLLIPAYITPTGYSMFTEEQVAQIRNNKTKNGHFTLPFPPVDPKDHAD